MPLGDLDLNLLVALDAILRERSVTKAAARLNLSQPAVSGALARLRRHFGDELIVRVGNESHLTDLGQFLRGRARDLVGDAERLFNLQVDFDPALSDREFTVATSDYVITRLMPALSTLLRAQAPGVRIRFVQADPGFVVDPLEHLRTIDVLIIPIGIIADVPHVNLLKDRWVLVISETNQRLSEGPTLEELADVPWVLTHHRRGGIASAAPHLRAAGIDPYGAFLTDSFLTLPFLVSQSDRVGLIPERLGRWLAPVAGCRVAPCPVQLPPDVEACFWHPLAEHDPGHTWFRRQLVEAAKLIDLPHLRPRHPVAPASS
jgi:DNA-binding transcriptional LysR family regulator